MSFEIGKIQQLTVPEHEQEITQKKRLAELGDLIAQYEASLKEFNITDIDVEKAKAELTVLTNELADKNSTKQYLQNEIAKANYELDGLKQQAAEHGDYTNRISAAKQEEAQRLQHVDGLKKIQAELEKSINDLTVQHNQLVSNLDLAQQNFEKEANQIFETEQFLKEKISQLETQGKQFQQQSDNLQEEINNKTSELLDLVEQVNGSKRQLEALQVSLVSEADEAQKKLEEMTKQKQEEWDKKDGDLSIREVWLADKIQQANAIKDELERTFNRKINIQF